MLPTKIDLDWAAEMLDAKKTTGDGVEAGDENQTGNGEPRKVLIEKSFPALHQPMVATW